MVSCDDYGVSRVSGSFLVDGRLGNDRVCGGITTVCTESDCGRSGISSSVVLKSGGGVVKRVSWPVSRGSVVLDQAGEYETILGCESVCLVWREKSQKGVLE